MKAKIFLFFLVFFLLACKKQSAETPVSTANVISERIRYQKNNGVLELKSGQFSYRIPEAKLPFKKVMLLNSSLTGYLLELGVEDKITGISSPEYIYSDKISKRIQQGKILDIGNEQKYNVEKILSEKPDAVFTNYIQTFENTYDLLKKNGVEVIFIDEYLEQQPLQKAGIIEVFGVLLGKEKEAAAIYSSIGSRYRNLVSEASKTKERPIVLANEMYGNQWFMPGGKTFVAHYFKDAAADYILKNNTQENSIPMSFEEVFVKSEKAQYWMNLGDHTTKKELLQINPNYAKMNIYRTGKLYSLSGAVRGSANDAFESGAVRADVVLKDYIKVFHPELFPGYQTVYLKEIR